MIKRIIARLDIKNNFLVKGMNLEGLRILGYPELFSKKYFDEGIDEIIFQDVVASLYKRNQLSHLTSKISENVLCANNCWWWNKKYKRYKRNFSKRCR